MQTISIDIETYSETSIKDAGVYKYCEDPAFTILLFACSIDGGPVTVYDLTAEVLPADIVNALTDPEVEKHAYNAAFERQCLTRYTGKYLDPRQWHCTMVKAAMCGLPFGLDAVAKALRLEQGKIAEGKALLKYFSGPCKPTKVNGGRTRNMPWHNVEKWNRLIEYNRNDVVLEQAIAKKIEFLEVPEVERQLWALDQKINDKGVLIDTRLVTAAILMDMDNSNQLVEEAVKITGLENPNSGPQLKGWLNDNGTDTNTLTKASVTELLQSINPGPCKRMLNIRQELAKTSNKKWAAMLDCINTDGRARGLIQFYGAGRTGRWAGRRIQPQNLPGIKLNDADLDLARRMVLAGDSEGVEMLFGNIPDTLSQLIRTAIIPAEGHRLIISDLNSIEARIIAWLSGERWRMEVFNTHGKIYEASAAAMFKVPIESVTKGSPLRQKGKIAELALGYQGGVNALKTMGALQMGIPEDDLQGLVYAWRNANKQIVQYWRTIQNAALDCVRTKTRQVTPKNVVFEMQRGILFITLPSGRKLAYLRPEIRPGEYGDVVSYEGVIPLTKQWGRITSYGGKFVENIVQAIARDVLADGMLNADRAGFNLTLTVHDELVTEESKEMPLAPLADQMAAPIPWAKGLPLGAEGFESGYYKK